VKGPKKAELCLRDANRLVRQAYLGINGPLGHDLALGLMIKVEAIEGHLQMVRRAIEKNT
jgi:hypothetical protein